MDPELRLRAGVGLEQFEPLSLPFPTYLSEVELGLK
jgi:hypothetical protein